MVFDTIKKNVKYKFRMEHYENTKLNEHVFYEGLMLNYGIILNRYEYKYGGGGVHHLC